MMKNIEKEKQRKNQRRFDKPFIKRKEILMNFNEI